MAKFKPEEKGGKLKPAGYQCQYTPEQIGELIKCVHDPIYFIENYCWIVHPTKGRVKFRLWDFQKEMILNYMRNDRTIVMVQRQCGKSQVAAAFLLWWACFKDNQTILIAANKGRSAKEIMKRIRFSWEEMPWFLKPGAEVLNVESLKFDNGSFIEAQTTTPTTGRGLSISLLYVDEYAYVPPNIAKDFWTSIQPTLSTGGRCIITSTPNTDEDMFARIWFLAKPAPESDAWDGGYAQETQSGDEDYETIYENKDARLAALEQQFATGTDDEDDEGGKFVRYHAVWTRHPERDEKFMRKQLRAGLTMDRWRREYLCHFVGGDETLIDPAKLLELNGGVRRPRLVDRYGTRWWYDIEPNQAYAVCMDPSEGTGGDNAVIQVWSIPQLQQVAEWASNVCDQIEQTRMLVRIMRRIYEAQQDHPDHVGEGNLYYSVERNGCGLGILNTIIIEGEERIPGFLIDSSGNKKRGLLTTMNTKNAFAMELKKLIERGIFIPRSKLLVSELKNFVKKGPKFQGKGDSRDDAVMSCVLMCHLLEEVKYHEDMLEEAMHVDLLEYDEDDENNPDNMAVGVIV
jgi:hypothetical protein